MSYIHPVRRVRQCDLDTGYDPAMLGCMSIHTNFSGSWNMADKVCQERGGYLWSVNDFEEWDETLRSPRISDPELKPINAVQYFRTSSVVCLGAHSQVCITL